MSSYAEFNYCPECKKRHELYFIDRRFFYVYCPITRREWPESKWRELCPPKRRRGAKKECSNGSVS